MQTLIKIHRQEMAVVPDSGIPPQFRKKGEESCVLFLPPEEGDEMYRLGRVFITYTKRFTPEVAGKDRTLNDIANSHACDGVRIYRRSITFMKLIGGPNSARLIADIIKDMIPRTCVPYRPAS